MEEDIKKDSIIFYKSFYTAIKKLPKKYQLEVYQAIFEKYFFGNNLTLQGIAKGIYDIIIPNIESANRRYFASRANGKLRWKTKKAKPKRNQTKT